MATNNVYSVEEKEVLNLILSLMKDKNITQKALCEALGYQSTQAVTNWKNGNSSGYMKKLPQIANVLNVPVDYFFKTSTGAPAPVHIAAAKLRSVRPIVGDVSAGMGRIAEDDITGWLEVASKYDREACFWLRVSGDSMAPKIEQGDFVLIDRDADVKSGDIAAVRVDGNGYLKQIKYFENSISLISINPYYPPMTYIGADCNRIEVIGRAVRKESEL